MNVHLVKEQLDIKTSLKLLDFMSLFFFFSKDTKLFRKIEIINLLNMTQLKVKLLLNIIICSTETNIS